MVAQEAHQLLAEVQDAARRVAAQIDNRTSKLTVLLNDADGIIERLETLLGSAKLSANQGPAPQTPPAETQHRRVYALADAGIAAREIAQRCDMQPGEVALVLALREKSPGRPQPTLGE